jgi:hypothetical protein
MFGKYLPCASIVQILCAADTLGWHCQYQSEVNAAGGSGVWVAVRKDNVPYSRNPGKRYHTRLKR